MVRVSEEADSRKVRVFRWNEKLRKNRVSDCQALFMFRISDRFITIKHQIEEITRGGISEKVFIFDRIRLLSDNSIKSLAVEALNTTNQFLPNTVLSLAHQISTYIISRFRFSPQNLLRRNLPRIVIVVDVDRSRTANYRFRTTHPIRSPLFPPSSPTPYLSDSSDDELDEEFRTIAAQDGYEDPIYNWEEDTEDLFLIMATLPQKLGERGKYPLKPIDTDEPVGFFEVDPEKDHVWKPTKDDRSTAVGLCPICLHLMSTDTMDIIYETCCLHVFHRRCISVWLSKSNSCPTCRFQLS